MSSEIYRVLGFNKHRITDEKRWVTFFVSTYSHRIIAAQLVSRKPNDKEWKIGNYTVIKVPEHQLFYPELW